MKYHPDAAIGSTAALFHRHSAAAMSRSPVLERRTPCAPCWTEARDFLNMVVPM